MESRVSPLLRPYLSLSIFVYARDLSEKEAYDNMVVEVNETQVDAEERLSDHCYFYDGQTGEIRMCA